MMTVLLAVLLDLGATGRAWDCAKLPPTDFSRFAYVYCTDAEGSLVTLKVERVEKAKTKP